MMLPGALKYGGIYGFVPLWGVHGHETLVSGGGQGGRGACRDAKGVTNHEEKAELKGAGGLGDAVGGV